MKCKENVHNSLILQQRFEPLFFAKIERKKSGIKYFTRFHNLIKKVL